MNKQKQASPKLRRVPVQRRHRSFQDSLLRYVLILLLAAVALVLGTMLAVLLWGNHSDPWIPNPPVVRGGGAAAAVKKEKKLVQVDLRKKLKSQQELALETEIKTERKNILVRQQITPGGLHESEHLLEEASSPPKKKPVQKQPTKREMVLHGIVSSSSNGAQQQRNKKLNKRTLKFEDMKPGEYVGSGWINVVSMVELPKWVYLQHGFDPTQKFILKFVFYQDEFADVEITAMEHLNSDNRAARRAGILPLLFAQRNMSNPYVCGDGDYGSNRNEKGKTGEKAPGCTPLLKFHPSFDKETRAALKKPKVLDVLVVPYMEENYLDPSESMKANTVFFKSMLEQLAVAHRAGINNWDLNIHHNAFVNPKDGRAILFDWNGGVPVGEQVSSPSQDWSITPPEAWLETYYNHPAKAMTIQSGDVWQLGLVWAEMIYAPCAWASFPRKDIDGKDMLRLMIESLGGNTIARLNDTMTVDLATLAGLQPGVGNRVKFTPFLANMQRGERKCKKPSIYLTDPTVPQLKKDLAIDLLRSMLKISPDDRPLCDTLLQHPFFKEDDNTIDPEEAPAVV